MSSGEILGAVRHVTDDERDQLRIDLLSEEALKSSAIEGEVLDRSSVQSSLRRQFGLATDGTSVKPREQGVAEMMADVYSDFSTPLWGHVNPGCDDCDNDMTLAKTPISSTTFISDPGHGWLVVSLQRLLAYGITEAMISPYSYRSPDGTEVALEEDCDAAVFLDAFATAHGAPPFIDEEHRPAEPHRIARRRRPDRKYHLNPDPRACCSQHSQSAPSQHHDTRWQHRPGSRPKR